MSDERQAAPAGGDLEAVEKLRAAHERIRSALSRVIVGQDEVLDLLLIAMFSRGHVILEGVPGLAKTLMISSLAKCLGLKFSRIQFTPDLMPSDITGTEVIQEDRASGERSLHFLRGPVFAHVILADEINRTPPKTQAALLEAMQERQVTVGGARHELEPPFFVLATQNPIEQEGTYPLPEAQQDRFMFKVLVEYPDYDDEFLIAQRTTTGVLPELSAVLEREDILRLQEVVLRVPVAPHVIHHALRLVRMTRPGVVGTVEGEADAGEAPVRSSELVDRMVTFGAGPRAVQFMLLGGKVRALLQGRHHVALEDVRAMAAPVLRHRIITNYTAEAEGYSTDRIVSHVLAELPAEVSDASGQQAYDEVLGS